MEQIKKKKKYFNKVIWSNLALTYSIIFLVLTCTCRQKAFGGDSTKFIANISFASVIIAASLACLILFAVLNFKSCKDRYSKNTNILICLLSLVPLVGAISCFIFKFIENRKDPNRKAYAPSAYVILFYLILFVALIVWIIYLVHGKIQTGIDDDGKPIYGTVPGLLDVIWAPIAGFADAADLVVFLLVIGGFLQIVNTSKSIEAGVSTLIKKMKGREILLVPLIMLFFSIGGTTFGMCEETLPFYLILTPVFLAAGFDTLTAIFTICFGAGIGVAGSILNPFCIIPAVEAAGVDGLTTSTGIAWRAIIYLVLVIVGIACVTYHAYRVKKDPKKSIVYDLKKEHSAHFKIGSSEQYPLTTQRKAILWIFGFTFLVMIIMVINWEGLIPGFTGFTWFNNWLVDNLPFISSNLGPIGSFGLVSMTFLFLFSAILVGIITWTSEQNFLQNFFGGAKDFIGVAFIIAIARGLSLILMNSGVNSIMIDGLSLWMNKLNAQVAILLIFGVFVILSFLIPSTSGFAGAVFPTMGPTIAQANITGLTVSGSITTFSLANGFVNLFSPTAGPLVAGLELCKTPLNTFYKGSWKILGILLVTIITMLLIGTLLPNNLF